MNIRCFCLFIVIWAFGAISINEMASNVDIFSEKNTEIRNHYLQLTPHDSSQHKLIHAIRNEKIDVGLFGNSRSLMIGADDIELDSLSFFNFAVGGQSFRHSVRMLNYLKNQSSSPSIAVLSFDHVELGLPGGAPVIPSINLRPMERAEDLIWLLQHDADIKKLLIHAWNYLWQELETVSYAISFSVLKTNLEIIFSQSAVNSPHNVRADGSVQEVPQEPGDFINWRHPARAEHYPLLEKDLELLASIKNSGTRVVIYESPLAPEALQNVENHLSHRALAVRNRLKSACTKYKLECYSAPLLPNTEKDIWGDATHAPARTLGGWLKMLIEKSENKNDI